MTAHTNHLSTLTPSGLDSLGNTICPKIGAAQWTCTGSECTCHLKARAIEREYNEAVKHRPPGACYCDLDDRACYAAGHWHPT